MHTNEAASSDFTSRLGEGLMDKVSVSKCLSTNIYQASAIHSVSLFISPYGFKPRLGWHHRTESCYLMVMRHLV
jgi:hypothetical protein